MEVTLRSIPIYARAGAFIFEHPAVQHTGELAGQPLRIAAMPGADGESTLYEDDGETSAYKRGMSLTRVFRQRSTADRVTVTIGAPDGPYRPASRDVWLLVRRESPSRVAVGSTTVPRVAIGELRTHLGAAWAVDADGRVNVRFADDFLTTEVSIEGAPDRH